VFTSGRNSTDVLVLAFGVAEALTLALVGEGCLLLAAIPSVLLFLVQLAVV
jgi:biopolymer transport protein ExbB/TolQ